MPLQRKYCFVVGAGGSQEFEFPTGRKLVDNIASVLAYNTDDFGTYKSGDRTILGAFETLINETPHPEGQRWSQSYIFTIAEQFRRNMGLAPSIDNFIESVSARRFFPEVGKIAIARVILESERNSKLFTDRQRPSEFPDFAGLPGNWIKNLFWTLVSGAGLDEYLERLSCYSFVTFNYDRNIEKFFRDATMSYFDLPEADAISHLQNALRVHHVYGSLGDLLNERSSTPYGSTDSRSIYNASKSILTFSEGVADNESLEKAKGWIEESDLVFFLGFSFLPLNVAAIKPDGELNAQVVYATSLGMSQENLNTYRSKLHQDWKWSRDPIFEFRASKGKDLVADLSSLLLEDDLA